MKVMFMHPRQLIWRVIKRAEHKIQRLKTTYHQKIGRPGNPTLISLPIIAQCNYRCNFCEINGVDHYLKAIGGHYQHNQMSVAQVMQFSHFIRNARDIDFGGLTALGEPLLSTNFIEIMKAVRKLNKRAILQITTNGRLMDTEISDFLLDNGPIYITFSLHAATGDVYTKVMGKGFDKVIQNIGYFSKKAHHKHNIGTSINFGLGKFNFLESEKIVRLAKDLNIRSVHMYPYYKSPNHFDEDVSLYTEPDVANRSLDSAYKLAKELGQAVNPSRPAYLRPQDDYSIVQSAYTGGCTAPYESLILKSTPILENKISFGVCNRIVLFTGSLEKEISQKDLEWMWHHPAMNALRSSKDIPAICKFCQNPATPVLRSINQDEYKRQRDKAVREHLSKWQENIVSPNGSIELLAENIFNLE